MEDSTWFDIFNMTAERSTFSSKTLSAVMLNSLVSMWTSGSWPWSWITVRDPHPELLSEVIHVPGAGWLLETLSRKSSEHIHDPGAGTHSEIHTSEANRYPVHGPGAGSRKEGWRSLKLWFSPVMSIHNRCFTEGLGNTCLALISPYTLDFSQQTLLWWLTSFLCDSERIWGLWKWGHFRRITRKETLVRKARTDDFSILWCKENFDREDKSVNPLEPACFTMLWGLDLGTKRCPPSLGFTDAAECEGMGHRTREL